MFVTYNDRFHYDVFKYIFLFQSHSAHYRLLFPSQFPDPPRPKQSSYSYVHFVSLCVHSYVSLIRAYGSIIYRDKGNLTVAKLLKKKCCPSPSIKVVYFLGRHRQVNLGSRLARTA